MNELVLLALLLSTAQARDEVRCTYTHREVCNHRGCTPAATGDMYLLVPSPDTLRLADLAIQFGQPPVTIRRCDSKGCTPVEVTSAPSGVFLNVWKLDGGYMLKFFDSGVALEEFKPGQFVEVATAMLGTFVSYGRCPWERW